jgi:hypothetical protein
MDKRPRVAPPWSSSEWFDAVDAWARNILDQGGLHITDASEQMRIRPWSAVLRIPTDHGNVYFKANLPVQRHEPALAAVLFRHYPNLTLKPIAIDAERGWMLMPDGGSTLRSRFRVDRDLTPWRTILPLFAQLQVDLAQRGDILSGAAVPDCRLGTLSERYAELLEDVSILGIDQPGGLTAKEYESLCSRSPEFTVACALLAEYGLPETLQHGDLNDSNIFASNSAYRFFDWGDSTISHPFFSMVVALRTIAWISELPLNHPEILELRDLYLAPFASFLPQDALQQAFALAFRIGTLCQPLTWQSLLNSLPESAIAEYAFMLPRCLKEFLAAFEEDTYGQASVSL